ncbi:Gfo/Idh/MocA family protein [Azotobacter vinelandii]
MVAVASRSRERAADFARTWSIPGAFGDVQEMLALDRLDAVYVATPHNHHYPDALKVIEAGKHVLIEKNRWRSTPGKRPIWASGPGPETCCAWKPCGAISCPNTMC